MSDPQPRHEPTAVARDMVTELAHQHPDEFADFWRKTSRQQTKLIEQFGTSSDRELWHKAKRLTSPKYSVTKIWQDNHAFEKAPGLFLCWRAGSEVAVVSTVIRIKAANRTLPIAA